MSADPLPEFADGMAASVEHDSPESMQAPQTAVEVEETKTFKDLVRVDDPSFPLFFLRQARAESGCLPSRPVVCGSSRGLAQISPRVPEAQVQDEGPPLTPSLGGGKEAGPRSPICPFLPHLVWQRCVCAGYCPVRPVRFGFRIPMSRV